MTGGGRLTRGFALAIRELMQRGWSRDDIAAELDVKPPTLSRWTTGERSVPIDVLPLVDGLCDEPRGYVLRLSDLVEDEIGLKSRIASASELDGERREILGSMYEVLRRDRMAELPVETSADTTPAAQEKPDRLSPAEKRRLLAEHNLESARPKSKTPSQADDKAG